MKKNCSQTIKDIPQSPAKDYRRKVITRFNNPPYFAECRHKIRLERLQRRKDHFTDNNGTNLTGLYFDGKRDVSLVNKKKGNKFFSRSFHLGNRQVSNHFGRHCEIH